MNRPWPLLLILLAGVPGGNALAAGDDSRQSPMLAAEVAGGNLPPLAQRLPVQPRVVEFDEHREIGRYGGHLRLLMGKAKDIRMMMVYGYARLVGHDRNYELRPDLLLAIDNKDNREFTLHLRPGHRWSDGHPFTAEDFRYYWEDVANDSDLSPFGPPRLMLVDGQAPEFEVLDRYRVRYRWQAPNPRFLSALAGARPLFIYRPAHYLRRFHARYTPTDTLQTMIADSGTRNWAGLHHRKDHQYKFDNPELPSLQPWINTTAPPSERFVFVRNPFYHRVDPEGRQLPYIDEVVVSITDNNLIPAKTGAGDSDLQARYLRFDNYTFLKQAESRSDYTVRLWRKANGSQLALYPNLNASDPQWRALLRERRFRRALSLAINRHEINQVVYYGLAQESANTLLPDSPLFRPEYRNSWSQYDPPQADALLDALGLIERDDRGVRLLPDGRPLELIVETAGESTEETDVLELIHDAWLQVGIKLYTRPSQREVFRNRVFSGEALMSVWSGLSNGIATADMSPAELAPTEQVQLQWPQWGQYFETAGQSGEPPDLPAARQLLELNRRWNHSRDPHEQAAIWHQMLQNHAEEVWSIGTVAGVPQPLVVGNSLRNLPQDGVYTWEPGAYFGIYQPDTFWFTGPPRAAGALPLELLPDGLELQPDVPYEPLLDQEIDASSGSTVPAV